MKNDSCKNMDVLKLHKIVKPTLYKRIMRLTWVLNLKSYLPSKFSVVHRKAPKCHIYESLFVKETFKLINEARLLNIKYVDTNLRLTSESHSSLALGRLSHTVKCKTGKITCGALRCSVNDDYFKLLPVDLKDKEMGSYS